MIAYFDTSALVPLLVGEATTERARAVWDGTERAVTVSLAYAELRAALARAAVGGRVPPGTQPLGDAVDGLFAQLDEVQATHALVRWAGALAERHGLRGFDAVHLAAALAVADPSTVLVAGDGALLAAAGAEGLAVAALR